MSETIETLVADLHHHLTSDANARLQCGISENLGTLPDPGLASSEQTQENARTLLQRFEAVQQEDLDFDTQLDVDLAS